MFNWFGKLLHAGQNQSTPIVSTFQRSQAQEDPFQWLGERRHMKNDSTNVQSIAPDPSVWGTNLNVPQRSQLLPQYQGLGYGGGGEVWCSPTSTSMVMAYWSSVLKQANLNQTVPDTAAGTYDVTSW